MKQKYNLKQLNTMMSVKRFSLLIIFIFTLIGTALYAQDSVVAAEEPTNWIGKVTNWYEKNMSYGTITALMAVESSFIPFPSEVVIPPAAYVASMPGSKLNIYLVVLFGTIGALIGAYINYFLALWLGRPIIYKLADSKFGRMMLLSSEKVQKAEDYFNKHGNISTFVGRLITVIRQLISLPAGLARMNLFSFTLYTALGAGIWNIILALVGYLAHGQTDLINKYSKELGWIIVALLIVVVIFLSVRHFARKNKKNKLSTGE